MGIDKFVKNLDIPQSAILNVARIEITHNTEASIEGIKGVTEYEEGKIKLDIGKKTVSFYGDGLCVKSFDGSNMTIEGEILSIEFETNN